jgi:hypothetical protein
MKHYDKCLDYLFEIGVKMKSAGLPTVRRQPPMAISTSLWRRVQEKSRVQISVLVVMLLLTFRLLSISFHGVL